MNILLITTISGFVPKFMMQDVRLLQALGHTVHYASNFDNPVYECDREALEAEGIICHSVPIAKSPRYIGANLAALRQLNEIVDQCRIAAIHCNNPMGGVLGRLAGRRGKRPYVIYTAHGFHFYAGAPIKNWVCYYPVEKMLAHRTNQLITINHEDRAHADRFRLRKGGAVVRIPGVGLDADRFVPRPEKRQEYRQRLGLAPDSFVFLAVGELNDNKNHRTVISAFSHLKEKCAILLICGEGPRRRQLQEQIDREGLADRVRLCGYQTAIEMYYQSADCFLFPSMREGLGMAAVEAMACGLPLIVGDNRGTREYARENAIVCKPLDEQAFYKAMQLLLTERERAARMGMRSVEVAAAFTREKTTEVMRCVYERMSEELSGTK